MSPIEHAEPAQQEHQPSMCKPTIVKYEPPSFNLQVPKQMFTRAERNQVLQNHVVAANATFSKVAVLEDLIQQEPHNAAHYKEVQRIQRNQHIQVTIKLQHMLEADDKLRKAAGLPQLDLPEHLWTVRNMDTAHIREQHFMAISSEAEVLCQQLKGKGMYLAPPTYTQITKPNVHFQPIQPAKLSPLQPQDRCIDFRKINNLQQAVITEGKSKGCLSLVPLPKIDEMYAKLKGAKFFSTIDLRSGYYHIALGKDSRAKTAFVMPFGKYEFLQVPFGLAQAPAYFQHLMNQVLDNCSFAMTYLDDIIIFSETEEQHLAHIEEIFKWLEAADLKMKRSKCDFFKKHIHYLGHLISANGIRPLKDKLDSIRDMPAPCNSKEVKQFLGLVGYYRKFVPCFAALSRPLSKLTCKDKVFEWTQECKKAFATLKEKLCAQPILQYADTTKGYTLYTDASKYGWAGVLTQLHTTVIDGKAITTDHPIAYVSGLFRGSRINWAALTKEACAIYMSVKKLSFYLTDAEVLLKSDHLPLKKFLQKNTLNNKVNNWAMELEAFNIKFQHVSGKTNILVDMLSRLVDIDPDA